MITTDRHLRSCAKAFMAMAVTALVLVHTSTGQPLKAEGPTETPKTAEASGASKGPETLAMKQGTTNKSGALTNLKGDAAKDSDLASERAVWEQVTAAFEAKDYTNCFKLLLKLTNSPAAQFNLGVAHAKGRGTAKDEKVALSYFEKAGKAGVADAQYEAGMFHELGMGTSINFTKAVDWYELAAVGDSMKCKPAANANLGRIHFNGIGGFPKDEPKGFGYNKVAADMGETASAYMVGMCYGWGRGTDSNLVLAAKYFRRAADAGHAEAQCELGLAYLNGRGVGQSDREAAIWLDRASKQNVAEAKAELGLLCIQGKGKLPQSPERAFALFHSGADQKHARSEFLTARCYFEGMGTSPNRRLGFEYLQRAHDHGEKATIDYIKSLYEQDPQLRKADYLSSLNLPPAVERMFRDFQKSGDEAMKQLEEIKRNTEKNLYRPQSRE